MKFLNGLILINSKSGGEMVNASIYITAVGKLITEKDPTYRFESCPDYNGFSLTL